MKSAVRERISLTTEERVNKKGKMKWIFIAGRTIFSPTYTGFFLTNANQMPTYFGMTLSVEHFFFELHIR